MTYKIICLRKSEFYVYKKVSNVIEKLVEHDTLSVMLLYK